MNAKYLEAVKTIKTAILKSQNRAAKYTNTEMLSLYYGIGSYVSANSRQGTWGTGAIEEISSRLREELPGLRGFSAVNIKFMRQFLKHDSHIFNQVQNILQRTFWQSQLPNWIRRIVLI